MRYLGVDYGLKKVGLAISEGLIASPLIVLKVSSLKDALAKISSVIEKENINRVVVGVPESGKSAKIVKAFLGELKREYQEKRVEIIETDEVLSTQDANNLMIELGLSQSNRKSQEDAYSAVLILQRFLNNL